MPVINKLIKKIRTCGLQKSPDPERSGPGVFFVYISLRTPLPGPFRTAESVPYRATTRYPGILAKLLA